MKEVIAIIRPGKDRETKKALGKLGCFACSTLRVYGRGKQRGLKYVTSSSHNLQIPGAIVMKYLPKKLISITVVDQEVKSVVNTIIQINQTGKYGDGKVFVLNTEDVFRIRTGEKGEAALR